MFPGSTVILAAEPKNLTLNTVLSHTYGPVVLKCLIPSTFLLHVSQSYISLVFDLERSCCLFPWQLEAQGRQTHSFTIICLQDFKNTWRGTSAQLVLLEILSHKSLKISLSLLVDSLLVLSGVGGRGDRSGWTRGTGRQWLKTVLVPGSCAFWATGQTLSFIPSHKGSWITQDTKDRKWPKQNEQQASLCKVGGRPISSTLVFATTHVNVHTKLTHQLHVCPLISMQFGMLCVVRLLPTYQHTESLLKTFWWIFRT